MCEWWCGGVVWSLYESVVRRLRRGERVRGAGRVDKGGHHHHAREHTDRQRRSIECNAWACKCLCGRQHCGADGKHALHTERDSSRYSTHWSMEQGKDVLWRIKYRELHHAMIIHSVVFVLRIPPPTWIVLSLINILCGID